MKLWPFTRFAALEQRLQHERDVSEGLRTQLWGALMEKARAETTLEALKTQRTADKIAQAEAVIALRTERDHLLHELLELRREGFAPPSAVTELAPSLPDLPGAVTSAIEELATPGTPLYHSLSRQAARTLELQPETDVAVLAQELLRGGDVNPF